MKKTLQFIGILTAILLSFSANAQTELTPLSVCDDNNDGYEAVDLTVKIDEILNGDNAIDYMITFHETITDAENNISEISDPEMYFNVDPSPYMMYFRKENNDDQTFSVGYFEIIFLTTPEIGIPSDLYNPAGTFDLTSNDAIIMNGNPSLVLGYYTTIQDAQNNSSPIVNVANYTAIQNTTIWVRAENTEGCSKITSFNLILDNDDNIVYIPDANFKTKLLQANTNNNIAQNATNQNIKIDINNDGEIQVSEALNVAHLTVYQSNISDLTGIGSFSNLQYLESSSNNLTELDFSGNPNLVVFWAFNNPNLGYINIKSGSAMNPDNVDEGSWMEMWGNLPDNTYICADESEIDFILPYLNMWGNTNQIISSYCTYYPAGDYNTITGTVAYDLNNDGCDNQDLTHFVKIKIENEVEEGATFTNEEGTYVFFTQTGEFTLIPQLENPSYFNVTPATESVTFTNNNNNVQTVNFCITPNGVHPDLEVVIAPIIPARPGFEATYKVAYRNKGNQILSQEYGLNFFYNQHLMSFVSATVTPETQGPGGMSWSYENLEPFESREIVVTMSINSPTHPENPVNIDDVLVFTSVIMPQLGDENVLDNTYIFNQTVVGAYDPNDITCIEGEIVSPNYIGEELHYVIRFENTGNYYAENVVVVMQIDTAKYDVDSVRLLNTSHNATAQIKDDVLEIFFNQIYLDSGGHGNILLVMKSINTLSEGDSVQSKADIYFDFNYPIITNDAVTLFQATMSVEENIKNIDLRFYPNPTTDYFNITSEAMIQSVELYDVLGKLVRTSIVNGFETQQNVSNLTNGVYILKIKTQEGEITGKIIKK